MGYDLGLKYASVRRGAVGVNPTRSLVKQKSALAFFVMFFATMSDDIPNWACVCDCSFSHMRLFHLIFPLFISR